MFHTVSDKKYKVLGLCNKIIAQNDYLGLDPRIIPTLHLLSHVDGVETVWSCSGHTPAEYIAKREKQNKPAHGSRKWDDFYFIFGAGQLSEPFISFLSKYIGKKDLSYYLKMIHLNWAFDDKGYPLRQTKNKQKYPVWEFGFKYDVWKHGEYLEKIEHLNQAIVSFIMEQNSFLQMAVSHHATNIKGLK